MSVQHPTQYHDVPSWELSDSLWDRIKPLVAKPKTRYRGRGQRRGHIGGRPRADPRRMRRGIFYGLRTGCQCNAAPRESGLGKTLQRYFQRWPRAGVFKRLWQQGRMADEELKGIAWRWQAADGTMTKAPRGGEATGPNPTDRAKGGTKRRLLVDGRGAPLGIVVSGANRAEVKWLGPTLKAMGVDRPAATAGPPPLCLDQASAGQPTEALARAQGDVVPVPDKANAKQKRKRQPDRRKARRWVVEVAHSGLNRFRRLLVRWEKKKANYLSMRYFAWVVVCWRKCEV